MGHFLDTKINDMVASHVLPLLHIFAFLVIEQFISKTSRRFAAVVQESL